jgi:hypothetical protein
MDLPVCDDGALLAALAGEPVIAGTEEGLGPGDAGRGLAEGAADPWIALAGGAGFSPAGGLPGPGRELSPGHQVPGGGEPGHIHADPSNELLGADLADAGDLIQLGHLVR